MNKYTFNKYERMKHRQMWRSEEVSKSWSLSLRLVKHMFSSCFHLKVIQGLCVSRKELDITCSHIKQ